ncbi:MAG: 50S ribosomal protein L25 [Pseudobutyrivibrio sp.]|nr:50S ribosomal protein L25 [Pseudobutyrivibrio sp.]
MNTLKAQRRETTEKAKKLRREGYVTGNLFGRQIEGSILLKIEKKEAERIMRECMKGSQIMLEVEGKEYDVLIKEMDYDAMTRSILEMDFQELVKGEKVHSVAEIVLHNKDKVIEGALEQLLEEVAYKATPEHLVDKIDVDCSTLHLGDTITVGDLAIAKNKDVDVVTHLDSVVVTVLAPNNADIPSDEDAEETAE